MTRILVAGESWSVTSIHTKGFDSFTTVHYAEGGQALIAALDDGGYHVTYMPSHVASNDFPGTVAQLNQFDVVLLSDIGSNSLLLPNSTFLNGQPSPNRLTAVNEWVSAGGGFGMIGGYLSFQGIEARANYRHTPIGDLLPVHLENGDDREEAPQGAIARLTGPHPVTDGVEAVFPPLLGYQRLLPKSDAQVLAAFDSGHPLLVVGEHGGGRTLAFSSDIGPHWAPETFTSWSGFRTLWQQAVAWLARV